jgi:peptidoglycan hydrolase-like protein with peptidoglycan-binding domain
MHRTSSPFRFTGGLLRAVTLMGALALVAATAACIPDLGPGVAATQVGQTQHGSSSSGTPDPVAPTTTAVPTTTAPPTTTPRTAPPKPSPTSEQPAPAPAIVLQPGDTGPKVRSLQARLRQIGWFSGDVSDRYGSRTEASVRGFQTKRGYDATGTLDEHTWDKLISMTHRPTADELANVKPAPSTPAPGSISWDVDERCMTGRVMCISKSTRRLTWVVDGVPQYGFDVRFGSDELPTREGVFSVYKKKVDVISNLYHTPMPYSMFFSGGQAVHYSSNFARLGYSGASHGCVNVRNKPMLIQLYNEVRIGDKVVVHW